ncbi:membrane protein [Mesorhizobium sp. 131-2-5]|uniref:bifunctional DedA family/phosphatase PAP2 family protein n=1 Tax=Mesorhizobium sp. 131-2-5 TaxID=2744519 RepID=UPI001935A0BF|nr:bifunctional DedA family/phosphatase PAP2 family protein [Mesorhizobium sp. 131-2-5]BCG98116.1 membrane protein [Mesorhizobium sp. 131-2-5]
MSFFSALTDYIASHPHLAYAAIFLLALSESVPVIGAVVPGTAIIVGLAALVPSGVLMLWPMLIAAFLGAIVGDGLSFWLGHRYHREILLRWPLNRYPELVARSEAFFERHGGKSVFLARFTPGVRAFIPLVAGMLRMPSRRFYYANILSAFVWAPSHILPGVFVGAYFSVAGAAAGRLAVLLVALIIILWVIVWVVRHTVRRGIPILLGNLEQLRAWSGARDTWTSRQIRSLLDPAQKETKILAALALLLAAAAWTFFGILEDVVSGDPLVRTDAAVYRILQDLRTPVGDSLMVGFTELGDTTVVVAIAVLVFLWLAWKRAWRTAAYWVAAIGGAAAINTGIKVALHRARPTENLYSGWSDFSFPSGHSTENAVLYGFLAFLIAWRVRPAWGLPVALAAAVLVALIAFSRLYLGAHWFSDVAGGLAFATAWLALLCIAYLHHQPYEKGAGGLLVVACAGLVVAGGYHVYRNHTKDMERYAVQYEAPSMPAADWWARNWRQMPAQRIDLAGEIEEPLTFQWAGSLERLKANLAQKGWRQPVPWSLAGALAWFTPGPGPMDLPTSPYMERGRLPSLTLVHPRDEAGGTTSRFVLRIWATDIDLRDGHPTELWIGSVVEEQLGNRFPLFTVAQAQPDANAPRGLLAASLEPSQLVTRPDRNPTPVWDGQVLLAHDRSIQIDQDGGTLPSGSARR